MKAKPGYVTPGELLEHAAWVKRLAVALVGREDVADDLVQDAWMVALRSPPEANRPVRPWLAGVLRNLAYKRWRGDGRRQRREKRSLELVQDTPTPERLVGRAETAKLVLTMVLELDEPYRSTVLMRYDEMLSSVEIAERLGLPAGTVRSRLKHGMDRLRSELDRRHNGDRKAWCVALMAFGRRRRFRIPVAWGMAGLACAIAFTMARLHTPRGAHAAVATAMSTPAAMVPLSKTEIRRGQPGAPKRRVAGRVVYQGQPVAGALVRLIDEDTASGGAPEPMALTDAQGGFDLGLAHPRLHRIIASLPGRAAAEQTLDLADPTLRPPSNQLALALLDCTAALEGSVVDASGGPIAGAHVRRTSDVGFTGDAVATDEHGRYRLCLTPGNTLVQVDASGYGGVVVDVESYSALRRDFELSPEAVVFGRTVPPAADALVWLQPTSGAARMSAIVSARTDAAGRFRLAGVAAGAHVLGVYADDWRTVDPIEVEAAAGGSHEVVARVVPAARVAGVVMQDGVPVAGAQLLLRSRAQLSWAQAVSQADGSFVITRVPPGELELEVDRFELRGPRVISAGQGSDARVRVEVAPLATLRGRIVRGGVPVVWADVDAISASQTVHADSDAAGGFELRGLWPGTFAIKVRGAGGERGEVAGVVLARGQTRDVEVEVDAGAAVRGRVIDAGGAVAGAFVHLLRDGEEVAWTTADGDGQFALVGLAPGEYAAEVRERAGAPQALRSTTKTVRAPADGVSLRVERSRLAIVGRVVDADGNSVADAHVVAKPRTGDAEPRFFAWDDLPATSTATDGTFRLTGLPAQRYALRAHTAAGEEATVGAAAGDDVTIVLGAPARIEGTLVGFAAPPQVWVSRLGEYPVFAQVAGDRFATAGLGPGTYRVVAVGSGSAAEVVKLAAGAAAKLTLRNRGNARLAGRLLDLRTGRPVEGIACVRGPSLGADAGWEPLPDRRVTDSNGAFDFGAGPAGDVVVECWPEGGRYVSARAQVSVAAGGSAAVELHTVRLRDGLELDRPGTLPGIGAMLDVTTLRHRIVSVDPDGPADRAGLRTGDVVLAVGDVKTDALASSGVAALVGDRSPVQLSISRGGDIVRVTIHPEE